MWHPSHVATVREWIAVLDRLYPPSWAEDWDNPGLQVGDPRAAVARVLVALDPTMDVIQEAAAKRAELLVTHHPLVFRPLTALDLSQPVPTAVAEALARGVAVMACHTNADVASPGVSDILARSIGLQDVRPLVTTASGRRVKLVTFVPPEATPKVLEAMAGAGAGLIGEYDTCSFRVRGTGTFRPGGAATPAVGEKGELNEVEEDRLEILVPRDHLSAAVEAMVGVHPYEEVAYDVYPLEGTGGMGLGRVGELPEDTTARDLAARCERALGVSVRLAGADDRRVRRIAVCGGSGGSLVLEAVRSGADAFVTGDLKHDHALQADEAGLVAIDGGHHGTEWPFVLHLADRLSREGPPGEVLVAETPTDPFRSLP
jgi:dinuclear metal center YbgI/SA1388 family protein